MRRQCRAPEAEISENHKRPDRQQRDGEAAQSNNTNRMNKPRRGESHRAKEGNRCQIKPLPAFKNNHVKNHNVPQRRKAAKIIFLRLGVAIGESIKRGHQQKAGCDNGETRRHQLEMINHQSR